MPMSFKDASFLSVLQEQITNVNVRVMEAELSTITYPDVIPVNTNYGEWQFNAASITFNQGVGQAQWITGYAKDVPLVELSASAQQAQFELFSVGWETNIEEVGLAANVGFSIPDNKARVARRKAEEFIQQKAFVGDADKNWTGLINKTGVTILPASTKAATGTQWVNNDGTLNATASEIAADLMNLILGPIVAAGQVRPIVADTVGVPSLAYRALASTFTDALNGGISFLEYVQRQVAGAVPGTTFRIVEIPELASAATTVISGGGRAVAYRRSLDVLELPVAFPFRFLNEYKDAPLGYMVPGVGRFGQVLVHEPLAFRYLDGIQEVPA